MSPLLMLGAAIVTEVIATTALKSSDGFQRLAPGALAIVGYCISFYLLSQVMKSIPTGVVYAIWSGLGIVLITIASFLIYRQTIDLAGMLGMGLIIAGVVVLNVFSKSASH